MKEVKSNLEGLSSSYLYSERYFGKIYEYDIFSHNPEVIIGVDLIEKIIKKAKHIRYELKITPDYSRLQGATIGFVGDVKFALFWDEKEIFIFEVESFYCESNEKKPEE